MSRPRWKKRNPGLVGETLGWMLKSEVANMEEAARFFQANLMWGDNDCPRQLAAIGKEIRRRGTGYTGIGAVPADGGRSKREKRAAVRKIRAAHPELHLSGPNKLGVEFLMWRLSERPDRPRSFAEVAAEVAGQLGSDLARHHQAATEREAEEIERHMTDLWRTVA